MTGTVTPTIWVGRKKRAMELIDGIAYLMEPAPTVRHQDIAGEIFRQIANALEGKPCRVFIAPVDVRLPQVDEVD
jgi:Putative restriction endonuclease